MLGEKFTEEPQPPLFLLIGLIADPSSRIALGPLFPFLRSGHRLFQRHSLQKQISSNRFGAARRGRSPWKMRQLIRVNS